MIVFLDTEFTDLVKPELLSIGLVSEDGQEFYVELDLTDEAGQKTLAKASEFVRHNGVIDQWGKVPGASATAWEMGRRTGEWFLSLAGDSSQRIDVAYDYTEDFQLLGKAIRKAGIWEDRLEALLRPVNINAMVRNVDGERAKEESLKTSSLQGLQKHHALADARALRASYLVCKAAVALKR